MAQYRRYAVYYVPRDGEFARRAAAWIGWDIQQGHAAAQPTLSGLSVPLANLTKAPRKYGFHGTIRAPFRMAEGVNQDDLSNCVADLVTRLPQVILPRLTLRSLYGFIALVPEGEMAPLNHLAAEVVRATNLLRAPLSDAEYAKRRPDRLTDRQRALLNEFGYPRVIEEFQFHLTLTDRLPKSHDDAILKNAAAHFDGALPEPFTIDDLCLCGEDSNGQFHLLQRFQLRG